MALFNYTAKEITLKVVYYGPGFSGKTTSLQYLHTVLPTGAKGKLISMATEGDRTIFFDFLPIDIGKIKDFNIRFQMYTVPGQVRYNATRRLVLKGADAIIFVADSQIEMNEQNIESYDNMIDNLTVNNISLDIPKVLQYNKRDISNIMSIEELNSTLNEEGYPYFETVAAEGKGVNQAFERITKDVLEYIKEKHNVDIDVPITSIIDEDATPSKLGKVDHIHLRDSKASPEARDPFTERAEKPVAAAKTRPVTETVKAETGETAVPPPAAERMPSVKPVTSRSAETASPVVMDISEVVSAIKSLNESVADISRGLRGIQINQIKNTEALNELKQIFSKGKDKWFKRFLK